MTGAPPARTLAGAMAGDESAVAVCLGFPPFAAEPYLERLRALGPRLDLLPLPAGGTGAWAAVPQGEPVEEPPPWARERADERRAVLARAEVMVALHAPRDLMALAPRLRWLQGIGAGVEQFAKAGVSRDRVVVTNASGVSARSIAEFVMGRLLQVWKHFRELDRHQREHAWERSYGRSFAGSTLGIVGLGSIGSAVADRARAFGVHVLGIRRSHRAGATSPHADELFGPERLHEVLGRCDAVVLAAPESPETRHLIDAGALAAMRPGAVLVNVARGSLVDESALEQALRRGHLGAAALDVFEREPLSPGDPLWDAPNVYLSAHSSVSVDRYLDDVFELFRDNLARYLAGEPLRNRVDMRALGFR